MSFLDDLLSDLPDASVDEVRVGAFWTAVVVRTAAGLRCGLAATQLGRHGHGGEPAVRLAGQLLGRAGRELAALAASSSLLERSIGFAALNALLPEPPSATLWEGNAEEVIAQHGAGQRVALVGHFPFVARLRERVRTLWVLELQPQGDDLPAAAASQVIPQADVLALTGMTLVNGTFDELLALRRPTALTLVLGPSTPLSPRLFDHGVDLLSGAIVEAIEPVLQAVSQGAGFRQIHRAGVRLVTMQRPGLAQAREIARLEACLADLQARMPAHSIPPALMAELDEIEESLARWRSTA